MGRKLRRRESYHRVCIAAAGLSVALLVFTLYWAPRGKQESAPGPDVSQDAHGAASRAVYPYSVVRGGVYTAEEVASSMRDPVVAAHYAGLHASRVRPIILQQDRRAYVSFRMHNAVYWTRRPVKLARGERLLTDGQNFVRARCGNRISDIPRMPTVAEEPSESVMDRGEPLRPAPPLSPGRSLAIVPAEPSVLPHQLALSIPPAPGGPPSFGPVAGPMPFLPPGGAYFGGTPSGPAAAPTAPTAPPTDPGAPGNPGGGPVYDIPQPQPAPYTPGEIPWPRHSEPGPPTYVGQDSPGTLYYPDGPLPKPTPAIIPQPPAKPAPGDKPKDPKPPAPDEPGTPTTPPAPPGPPSYPPVYPPLTPDTPEMPPEPPVPPAPVPEPGTLALAPAALAALWLLRRTRR